MLGIALLGLAVVVATLTLALLLSLLLVGALFSILSLATLAVIVAGLVVTAAGFLLIACVSAIGTRTAATFFLFLVVESVEVVLIENIVVFLLVLVGRAVGLQLQGLLAGLVHGDNLECAPGADGHQVGGDILIGRVSYLALEHVGLEVIVSAVGSLEAHVLLGQFLQALDVCVYLKVETAFELGTLSGELLRVERNILETCRAGGDRHEVCHPRRATQRASARAYTTYAAGFLTGTYLLHLDAHLECIGQYLDELTEVDSLVGNIIEYRLVAVALILDVADFHVELEALGNLARAYHGVVLAGAGFLILLQVVGTRLAEDAAYLGIGLDVGLAHLQTHECAGERHLAYVVARRGLDSHHVADGQVNVGRVLVIPFSGILELDLDHVIVGIATGNVGQIVEAVQLASGAVATLKAAATLAGRLRLLGACRARVGSSVSVGHGIQIFILSHSYLAKLTARVSRITVILT